MQSYDRPFQPQVHYFVGGATKLYGPALYRLRAEDFGELRHHDGVSPAWPISYEDMEPSYTEAERIDRVHGARGPQVFDRADAAQIDWQDDSALEAIPAP